MAISIELPRQYEESLRAEWGDLERATKEALVIESYRRAKLSLGEVASIIGLPTRIAAQQWLAARGVPLNYDQMDLEADRQTQNRLLGLDP
jgi:predicted HTH domain antitoxin